MPQRTFTPPHLKIAPDPEEPHPLPPVVAMIIPAGDASAFERLFHRLPLSLGVSYLVVEYHGSPGSRRVSDGVERLTALLDRTTLLPVRMPVRDTVLEMDSIYLLPPGIAIELVRGRLIFQGPVADGGNDYFPDRFLASVGAGCAGRCAVVVLPDMAARVLPGLRVVRDQGGMTIVLDEQDPFSPPNQACRCPLVDLFLPAPLAALRLGGIAEYFRRSGRVHHEDPCATVEWSSVYRLLLHFKGCDYSRYRQEDVVRRIHRRMAIRDIGCHDAYMAFLQADEDELARLDEELQSTVSGFFIDAGLETELGETVLPRLLGSAPRSAPLRVWLPHCAGSHQAYSIAMAIMEYLETKGLNLSVQLFVTAFDHNAIAKARKGIFGNEEMHYVTRSRRKKFFIKKGRDWQVIKSLREKCIFATHDVLKDSPFSRMDIVIESASLVGFGAEDCAKAFRSFHYSLIPDGYLIANTLHAHSVPAELYIPSAGYPGIFVKRSAKVNFWQEGPRSAPVVPGELEADKLLLSGYVPASFLVDEQFRVLRYYGNTEPYLRAGRDWSSRHLFRIVRDELVFEIHDLIDLADKDGKAITRKGIQLGEGSQSMEVSVEMVPLPSFGGNRKLIIIREKTEHAQAGRSPGKEPDRTSSHKDRRIQSMEKKIQELQGLLLVSEQDATRLQEGFQRANEDLQASNKEFQSLNEELKSLNGELNDMYEEILARDKELNQLNEGLRVHIREIHSAADAAMAIVATLRWPILVLRDDLRIHTANRAFLHLFDLSSEQAVGQYLPNVGPELFRREGLRLRLQQVQTEKLGLDFELKHCIREGGERILHFSATRMAGMPGLRSGILLSIDDVTGQRDLQRFKDDLIGLASHELRTPATTIRAYSELLSKELMSNADRKSAFLVSKLSSQVDRLTGLTRDLMDVSRITRGRIVLEEQSFDLNTLITEVVEAAQPMTTGHISVDPLPPSPPFQGDRERIRRVLGNLLSNASKYAENAGQIGIRIAVTQENVRLSICVPGTGMPLLQMKKIFDQDYLSGDGSSDRLPGMNLGLFISSEIIRKHGGRISVAGGEGNDSVLSVVLPFDKKRIAELSVV